MKDVYEIAMSEDDDADKVLMHRTTSWFVHEIAYRIINRRYWEKIIWTRIIEPEEQDEDRIDEDQVLDAYERGRKKGREGIERLQEEIREYERKVIQLEKDLMHAHAALDEQ